MVSTITILLTALAAISSPLSTHAKCQRGLGWATDNRFAPHIGDKPQITWYHHWQDGPVPQMPSKVEYVPMFWGPQKWSQWSQRLSEMHKHTPKELMAFNEPDVSSQSNMNPYAAAQLYMEQINPWKSKGVRLGSPAIVWNLDWMGTFLSEVQKKGGHVDFICLHWYGSWNDLSGFKKYVQSTHARFNKNIWVTELGITTASHPSQSQVKNFMMNAFTFMDSQSYVERGAWFGSFESNRAPDNFATGKNALFKPGGALGDMGMWYGYTNRPDKRSLAARHHHLAARAAAADNGTAVTDAVDVEGQEDAEAVHCDHTCQLRNEQIAAFARELEGREPELGVEALD